MRKINYAVANEIDRNATECLTNKEMYNISRKGCYETHWFEDQFGNVDTKTTSFASVAGYTVCYLDNWYSGKLDTYMKIANYWVNVTEDQLKNLYVNEEDKKDNNVNTKGNLPETLGELVDRFATDDEYATKLINDEVEQDDFSDLYNPICVGLAEKYSEMTGKQLQEADALVIANRLIENRCDELGINCVVDSIEKRVYWLTCLDENGEPIDTFKNFKANTLPFVVKMAEAKANAMCVSIA